MQYYTGDEPGDAPGNLPEPYYWWEAGAMFGSLVDYWFYTGDDTWNNATIQGMLHQASPTANFMPDNQTHTEGNDDQGFWGIAALMAAERRFPNPPDDQPQWLALAQGVFNSQAARWNMESCGGGLKWQIFPYMDGYDYKNTVSNGCFFNMGARLALYTGNHSYAHWAEKTWDWMAGVGLMTSDLHFYDGAKDGNNCTNFDRIQWTYNAGMFLHGAAVMYQFVWALSLLSFSQPPNPSRLTDPTNKTQTNESQLWHDRTQKIIDGLHIFFSNDTDIMYEFACEDHGTCETDQESFKAYLARWMGATTQLANFTGPQLMPKLAASAKGAAKACTGSGPSGSKSHSQCGLKWTTGEFDGQTGIGEQMAALEVIQANLIQDADDPVTNKTGGTSQGNPGGGLDSPFDQPTPPEWMDHPITLGDKVGAGLLTGVFCLVVAWAGYWAAFTT